MNRPKILMIDDEPNLLEAIKRNLRQYNIHTQSDPQKALETLQKDKQYAVVVSDLRMPQINGIELLQRVKEILPDSVRMMLTGQAELHDAVKAVNDGNIFRFLLKPCELTEIENALESGLRQHQLLKSEKILLGKTLKGAIKVLMEVLSMLSPTAFGRASRVQKLASQIGEKTGVFTPIDLEIASLLSQIGCITVEDDILNKAYEGRALDIREESIFLNHPAMGKKLISHIPRLENAAEIVLHQNKTLMDLEKLKNKNVAKCAAILKLCIDYDIALMQEKNPATALAKIFKKDRMYLAEGITALKNILAHDHKYHLDMVDVSDLRPGMILAANLLTVNQKLLMAKGLEISESFLLRLKNISKNVIIQSPVEVFREH